jgi:hypothetical protein
MSQGQIFGAPNVYSSAALEAVSLVSGSSAFAQGCTLIGFTVLNNNAATRYIQVFDGYATPSGGAVPLLVLAVPATTSSSFSYNVPLVTTKTGLVVATSTTAATYTAGSGDMFVTAFWLTGQLFG